MNKDNMLQNIFQDWKFSGASEERLHVDVTPDLKVLRWRHGRVSKGRPRDGNKRSQHVLSQTVPSHKSDRSSWLREDGMILILSRWKPTNTTTSLCFNKKSARTDGRARSAETTNCCSITAVHVKHTGRPRLPLSDSSWGRWLPATRASEDFWWTKDAQRDRDKRSFHQI